MLHGKIAGMGGDILAKLKVILRAARIVIGLIALAHQRIGDVRVRNVEAYERGHIVFARRRFQPRQLILAEAGGDAETFASLCRELPEISRANLLSMGKIVQLYFKNITVEGIFNGETDDTIGMPMPERVAYYVRHCYMREITPRQIAERFFVNQSYLAREFRTAYGCTVTDYINRIRCENGARLLSGTSLPIASIALNVGYADANYFTRMFAREYGLTPREYRRKNS